MQLPNFVNKFLKKEEKEIEYFLSLLFSDGKIKAAVWKKEEGKSEIIGLAEKETTDDWKEIVKDADFVITKASGEIPQEKIKKVIFGLPCNWAEEKQIKEPYLSELKKLSKELSLEPIGFIIIDEAIINYLSKTQGSPATVILLGFQKENFTITVSKIGKIIGIKETKKEEGIALCEEMAKILKSEFSKVEVLPSKILLYNGIEDLEGIKQELISYPWLTKADFLHFPKIEILENNFDLNALVFSAAFEMGTKIKDKEIKDIEIKEEKTVGIKEEITKPHEIIEGNEKEDLIDEFGFVKDKDIIEETPPTMPDLRELEEEKRPLKEEIIESKSLEKKEEGFKIVGKKPLKILPFKFTLPKIPKINFQFNIFSSYKNIEFIILGLIIFFTLFFSFIYLSFSKAKVILYVLPKVIEKEEVITVDLHLTEALLEKRKLPGKEVSVEISGSKKGKSTGKKIVGEKAKGEVTIFNKTNYSKTFPIGSVLIGPNNLKFTLNEAVTVASQSSTVSSDESVTLTPGKVKAKITAVAIGAESNLTKGSEFTIEDYSQETYKAKNETDDFSGGLSREVSVVSKEDQEKLLDDSTNELLKKAKKDLLSKVSKNETLIDKTLENSITKKKFNFDVNEEAKEFNLDLTVKFRSLTYKNEDFTNLVSFLIEKTIPKDYEYKKEALEKEIKEVTIKKDKSVEINLYFKVNLFPKIDKTKIQKDLAGKNLKTSSDYLNKIKNVVGFEAKITPKLFGPLYRFPFKKGNIEVEVKKK